MVLNKSAVCKTLQLQQNAHMEIQAGGKLTIAGENR
jgi:hypothetical protein